ncbi:MAG: SoxR reducing system RseC family protein [Pseudomonadota bacterium]
MNAEVLLSETARVVAVEEGAVWLETIQQSSCGACSLKKGCGQSALQSLFDGKRNHMRLPTQGLELPISVNDRVEIGIPKTAVLHGSLALYLAPLIGMVTGMVSANQLSLSDGWVLLSGVLVMAACFALIRVVTGHERIERVITPRILKVLPHCAVDEVIVSPVDVLPI